MASRGPLVTSVRGVSEAESAHAQGQRMHLGLGTAQFGLDYGITNTRGRVRLAEVKAMLAAAADAGITLLDTASAYGDSESVIGELGALSASFRIATKLPSLAEETELDEAKGRWQESFEGSLRRLKREKIDLLLAHDSTDLLGRFGEDLWQFLQELKVDGRVEKIGVSVYTASETGSIIGRLRIDAIQLPFNALDARLVSGGLLGRLSEAEVEIHARSVFLQGLLLSPPGSLPPLLSRFRQPLTKWHHVLASRDLTPLQGALLAVRQRKEIGTLIFGATSLEELLEVNEAWRSIEHAPPLDIASFAVDDEDLLDPRRWPQTKLKAEA